MRLGAVDRGHDLTTRLTLRLMRAVGRADVPDVVKALTYRHRFFGTPFTELTQDLMRGPSAWTIGERELFATFTSSRNRCDFCRTSHQAVAETYQTPELVAGALAEPSSSGQRPEVVAVLYFLQKLSESPDDVSPSDVALVREAGVIDAALEDAVRISVAFHTINRIVNALDAAVPEGRSLRMGTMVLRRLGYRNPPPIKYLSRAR